MNRRREIIFLVTVIVVGLAVRLVFSSADTISPDSTQYMILGEQISHGSFNLEGPYKPYNLLQPGYSLAMVGVHVFIHDWYVSGIIVSLLAGLGLIIVTYFFTRKLFGSPVAMIAAVLVTLHPLFLYFSTAVLTESLFTLLVTLVAYMTWVVTMERKPSWNYLLIGGLIGVAYLVRLVGLFMIVTVILWILISWVHGKRLERRQAYIALVFVVIGLGVVAGPYALYLRHETNSTSITGAQQFIINVRTANECSSVQTIETRRQIMFGLNNGGTDYLANEQVETTSTERQDHSLLGTYWHCLVGSLKVNLYSVVQFFTIQLVFAAYGIAVFWRKKKILPFWYLLSWLPPILALYSVWVLYVRYAYPIYPLTLMIVALGIFSFFRRISWNKFRRLAVLLVCLVVFLIGEFMIGDNFGYNLKPLTIFEPQAERQWGQQLRRTIKPGAKIMSPSPIADYFAGAIHYPMPTADTATIIRFAQYNSINYLYIFSGSVVGSVPLDIAQYNASTDLQLVIHEGYRYLYKLQDHASDQ